MAAEYSFGKEERLKSNLAIQSLLKTGKNLSVFPLKIYWDYSSGNSGDHPVKFTVAVPKKKFRRAVDRNLLKRRIREAYRLNKNIIYDPLLSKQHHIIMVVLYFSDSFTGFKELEADMKSLLEKLSLTLGKL